MSGDVQQCGRVDYRNQTQNVRVIVWVRVCGSVHGPLGPGHLERAVDRATTLPFQRVLVRNSYCKVASAKWHRRKRAPAFPHLAMGWQLTPPCVRGGAVMGVSGTGQNEPYLVSGVPLPVSVCLQSLRTAT